MGCPIPAVSILVVEDEAIALEFLAATLARRFPHVAVHKADNGRTGLELFQSHLPDIVITDVNMPDMGGVQMAAKTRAIKPDTKLIVLTGDSSMKDSGRNKFQFDHCIIKPIDFFELFAVVDRYLEEIGAKSKGKVTN